MENFSHYTGKDVPLRIGMSLTIAMNSLSQAISQFQAKYLKTPLKLYAENVQQVQKGLLNGEIDIALMEGFASNPDLSVERLCEYALLVVCSVHQAWGMGGAIQRNDLAGLPFLLREKGSTLRDCFDALTHKLGVDISPVLESTNTEVLISAAKAGMGITVLPEPMAARYLADRVFTRLHLEGHSMSTVNHAVTLKGTVKNQRLTDLIQYFKKAEMRYRP